MKAVIITTIYAWAVLFCVTAIDPIFGLTVAMPGIVYLAVLTYTRTVLKGN